MLEKVSYDKYNEFNTNKKNDVMIQRVSQTFEIDEYRKMLVSHIARRELQGKAHTSWLSWFDDNCKDYYIQEPSLEQIEAVRGVYKVPNGEESTLAQETNNVTDK